MIGSVKCSENPTKGRSTKTRESARGQRPLRSSELQGGVPLRAETLTTIYIYIYIYVHIFMLFTCEVFLLCSESVLHLRIEVRSTSSGCCRRCSSAATASTSWSIWRLTNSNKFEANLKPSEEAYLKHLTILTLHIFDFAIDFASHNKINHKDPTIPRLKRSA